MSIFFVWYLNSFVYVIDFIKSKTFNTIKNEYLIEIDDYQGTKSHLRHGRVLSEDYFSQIIF